MDKCKCGSELFGTLEYHYSNPEYYDGASEYICMKCNTRYGRWTNKVLKEGEVEKRYGRK